MLQQGVTTLTVTLFLSIFSRVEPSAQHSAGRAGRVDCSVFGWSGIREENDETRTAALSTHDELGGTMYYKSWTDAGGTGAMSNLSLTKTFPFFLKHKHTRYYAESNFNLLKRKFL